MGPKTKQAKATAHAHEEAAAVWVERTALHAWDKNPRKNEKAVPKVVESIKRFGFASPIIARKNGEVIAGHTRLLAAEALGMDRVPVRYMDLDPAEAHLLALADNRLNEVAEWDKPVLQDVLSGYGLESLDVAGWSSADIDAMATKLLGNSADQEWSDMPEFENENPAARKIIINFRDEAHVSVFANALGLTLTEKTKSAWFPPEERQDHTSEVWDDFGVGRKT